MKQVQLTILLLVTVVFFMSGFPTANKNGKCLCYLS